MFFDSFMQNRFVIIDQAHQIPAGSTLDDIRFLTNSGRGQRDGTDRRDGKPKYKYRNGIITPVGDIEVSLWREKALKLVAAEGNFPLFENLRAWYKETAAWLHSREELQQYTLECFSNRIYDNPQWVDYITFNQKYRPNILLGSQP